MERWQSVGVRRWMCMLAFLAAMLLFAACGKSEDETAVLPSNSVQEDVPAAGEGAIPVVGIDLSHVDIPLSAKAVYIQELYQMVLGESAEISEVQEWEEKLESGKADGSDVLWKLFNREELEKRALSDSEYVTLCYRACLEKEPEQEEMSYWTGRLAEGERRVFLLYQLLKSDECETVLADRGIERGDVGAVSNALQKKVASLARNNQGVRAAVTGECAAWVSGVYCAAGLEYPGGNAIDYWDWWRCDDSKDMSKVPVGAAVVGSGSRSSAGLTYGHIGIYIGDGLIAHNAGGNVATISTVEEFEDDYCSGNLSSCYYSAYKGKQGILGWVWPMGNDLSQ